MSSVGLAQIYNAKPHHAGYFEFCAALPDRAKVLTDPIEHLQLTEPQIAARAVELMRSGAQGREAAASLLYRRLSGRVKGFFKRHRVPEDQAEELFNDFLFKFVTCDPTGVHESSAVALMWRVAHSVLTDWARRVSAERRGGNGDSAAEVSLADDIWAIVLDTSHGAVEMAGWIKDCVHRVSALFQRERPRPAETLLLFTLGYSHREIAAIEGASTDDVSAQQEAAAKSRVHHASKLAREYFKECLE